MTAPISLHQQLAELWSKYVRAVDGVERNRLGTQLDALAPLVLKAPAEGKGASVEGASSIGDPTLRPVPVLPEVTP